MEDSAPALLLIRTLERLLSVAIGGLSVYLGYRLFISRPELQPGDGSISVSAKTILTLTRVGPGTFFSLFGAVVVVVALRSSASWERIEHAGGSTSRYSSAVPAAVQDGASNLPVRRDTVERTIGDLNALPGMLAASVDDGSRQHLAMAVVEAKLALIQSAWGKDWGPWEDFRRWTEIGGTPPKAAEEAARIFGKGATP